MNAEELLTDGLKGSLKTKDRKRRTAERDFAERSWQAPPPRNDLLPALEISYVPIAELGAPARRLRRLNRGDILEAANSIASLGFARPVIVGRGGAILDGELLVEAARWHGLETVPCILIEHLSRTDERRLRVALNRVGQRREWDLAMLKVELEEIELDDGDISVLGFDRAELDGVLLEDEPSEGEGPPPPDPKDRISALGDLWQLGPHKLLCGDACAPESYQALMGDERAQQMLSDPPFGIAVSTIVSTAHREFVQGSGEQTDEEFADFLQRFLTAAATYAAPGAVMMAFMDWRKLYFLLGAGRAAGLELIAMPVWVKAQFGQGSLYRSQHEMIAAFKKPGGDHKNRILLGKHGRTRSNCWFAAGAGTLGTDAREMLAEHPTSKPVKLLVDAILDVTDTGDIVLDCFGGSGSTLLAARETRRVARLIELDPLYCDVILRRWIKAGGEPPVLAATGETSDRVAARRKAEARGSRHAD